MNQVQAFYQHMEKNTEIWRQFKQIVKDSGDSGKSINHASEETKEGFLKLAEAAGYTITKEDLNKFFSEDERELCDEELDSIAGGKYNTYHHYP